MFWIYFPYDHRIFCLFFRTISGVATFSFFISVTTQIFNADCFDILPNIDSDSIDLVILDLPYNQTACKFDNQIIDLNRLWKELKRIGTPRTAYVFFCMTRFGHKIISSNENMFRYDIVWQKTVSSGFYHCNQMPLRSHEMLYIFYDKLPTYNPQMTDGKPYTRVPGRRTELYTGNSPRINTISDGKRFPKSVITIANGNYKSKHPTAKPYGILEWIVKTYSNEDDLILDPFMGIGTIGKVCQDNNRKFIGVELDHKYYTEADQLLTN